MILSSIPPVFPILKQPGFIPPTWEEGGREGEGGRERGKEGGRRRREGRRKRGKEGGRERGREGGTERGR